MYIGYIFYENEYNEAFKYIQDNNLSIMYNGDDETGKRTFIITPKLQPTQSQQASSEINELKRWFDVEYARLEQKYRRLYTLKLYTDDDSYPYDKLLELYREAEYKRARIQELERLIANEMV